MILTARWPAALVFVGAAGALAQTEGAPQSRTIEVGRVEGSVRYRDGRPLVGAQVTLNSMRQDAPNGGFSQTRFGPTPLRADGTFVIDAVPVGDATIMVAMPPDWQTDARAPRDRPQRMFWERMTVSATGTTTMSLVNREVVLSGRVIRSFQPGRGLKVSHSGQGQWFRPIASIPDALAGLIGESVATEPDGSFTLVLPGPGTRMLQVSTTDDHTRFYASVDVPDADAWEQDLTVGGLAVPGIVVNHETGRPVKQATVYAGVGSAFPETRANDKGRFVLELPPGEHRVGAFLRDSPYVEARDVPVSVGEAEVRELRVPLVREPSIEGRVLGQKGRPVEGAFVAACRSGEARPGRPHHPLHHAQRSATDGAFHVWHLEKAAYSLAAHGPDGSLAFRAGVTSDTEDASLVLQAPATLPLRIVDSHGRPAGGALVTVEAIDGAPPCGIGSAPADPGGVAKLRLPASAKSIDVFVRQGTGAVRTAVPIGSGTPAEVWLELAER